MAYAFFIGNPRSNQAPTVRKSAKSLKLKRFYALARGGCSLERRGGAEAVLPRYRQMPRCRCQARRERPSFFILDCRVVRFRQLTMMRLPCKNRGSGRRIMRLSRGGRSAVRCGRSSPGSSNRASRDSTCHHTSPIRHVLFVRTLNQPK
jgi:hypothetical protein